MTVFLYDLPLPDTQSREPKMTLLPEGLRDLYAVGTDGRQRIPVWYGFLQSCRPS